MNSQPLQPHRILVIEDEIDLQNLLCLHLKRQGYDVTAVDNGEEALQILLAEKYHLIVVDWMLPGVSGLEICQRFRAQEARAQLVPTPILMVTARANSADIMQVLAAGANDCLTKPFEIAVFLEKAMRLSSQSRALSHGDLGTLPLLC